MGSIDRFLNDNQFTKVNTDRALRQFDCGITVEIIGLTPGLRYIEVVVLSPVKNVPKAWFLWEKSNLQQQGSENGLRDRFIPFLERQMAGVLSSAYGEETARRALLRGFGWVKTTQDEGKKGKNDPNM